MDLYTQAIHNNTMLTKGQKMQHLKGKLRGEAERLVQHLNISAENYDTCWEILTHRYNNLQLLFTKQIQVFMGQPAIQKVTAYELKRLHDTSLETIHAIHNLGVNTSTWDPILVHILTEKMDSETYSSYMEARKEPRNLPSFDELIGFLENKFTALEPVNQKSKQVATKHEYGNSKETPKAKNGFINYSNNKKPPLKTYHAVKNTTRTCPLCKSNHILIYCEEYNNLSSEMKMRTLNQLNVCKNCLYCHNTRSCNSNKTCKLCNKSHHTTLHDLIESNKNTKSTTSISQPIANHVSGKFDEILLATIELRVKSADGTYINLRCLLDQGSQINLITEAAAQRLGLQRRKQDATISGIGISLNKCKGTMQLVCQSLYNDYTFTTEALVMTKMLNNLPNYSFQSQQWPHLQNINLADPRYNISRPVDILLDAGVYSDIVLDGILRGPNNAPIAQQTKMGWVLLGNIKTFNCHAVLNNIEQISQFWETEEINDNTHTMTSEEDFCENLYQNTTKRRSDGRYEVKIPMKQDFIKLLGTSKPQAVAQFRQLEKRLTKDDTLCDAYKKFIQEYIELNHMKRCTTPQEPSFFLPHHGVIKPESTTTKLRAVFNGSQKSKSGYSLNELMLSGPNLQQDLLTMIIRWRSFQFVYTADIEKFYRQVRIQEKDQHLQKIVWRNTPEEPIQEYQLCTVTYGTKAAPYLAMRTIKQLIIDDGPKYPLAADILNNQLYVDDLLGGNNNLEQAKTTQKQLIDMLQGAGFNLRKWASNDERLLQDLSQDQINQNMLDFKCAQTNKTLGITWNPHTDNFTFQTKHIVANTNSDVITKRSLLSDLSKLYDPLGWLSPTTMKGKLIFQQVWALPISWDDVLPQYFQDQWKSFKTDLNAIDDIIIPRWVGNTQNPIELHGFCDASERGYACVIYCKSIDNYGQTTTQLLAGKTKLAPLNKMITLPRLELCGAWLLSRLMKKVIESLTLQTVTIHGWTDSTVVLGWLQGDVSRWKTFVANRVTKVVEVMPATCWRHVKSEENAADCATRGLLPSQLTSYKLWWEGPKWLKEVHIQQQTFLSHDITEDLKTSKQVCSTQAPSSIIIEDLLNKHSALTRAVRTLAWIMRFINNARDRGNAISSTFARSLTTSEIEDAKNAIIKVVQYKHFTYDITQLRSNASLNKKSRIFNLYPLLDDQGILRVGGRLGHSGLNNEQKHPIILPNKDKLTELLIHQAHLTTLHGGPRLTLSLLRDKFWILQGLKTVKGHIMKCITCHRFKSTPKQQLMADLPTARVTPSRPFFHTGVDFTGQVEVKCNKGRGIKTTKGYIALFICMVTKAIHLELVSDLSTSTFIAALKRLCSRRGAPKHVYSDNGTNFVGAAKVLQRENKEALQYYVTPELVNELSNSNIEWHFNAPAWPTAGGLWEAAVKSTKHHLRRVLGEQKLTFEEFSTLLTQIEACLNSRPLTPLTESIEDLDVLTPGHFLVGGPVLSSPLSPDIEHISLRQRWTMTEKIHKDFWKSWSRDYLQALQTRSKWNTPTENLCVGDMVLVKEDNIPPAKWLLGRVTDTHPGKDGYVRVVTLKTKNSELTRPITKLSRLPLERSVAQTDNIAQEIKAHQVTGKQKGEPDKHKKLKTSRTCFSTLFLLLMTCVGPTKQDLVNVTDLNPSRLIYFDKVADMHVAHDEWKMVVYYNMTTYWEALLNIEKYVNHLTDLCKKDTSFTSFRAIATQLQHELSELRHYNDVLQTEHGKRTKRGLINGVGYLANSLFGVLDDRFAEKYHKDIKLLQNNQNHMLNLYKQQTSVIEGEYNLLKRNEEVMNKQFIMITQHLNQTEERITLDKQNVMYITATALAANMILSNLRRVQQELLDLVTDVRNGRVDTHLLKPEAFENQLNIIARKLPNGLFLPCTDNYGCIREMYKVSRVHVKLTEEFFIFEVKIPLLASEQQYELTRVVPIKSINKGIMSSVIPTTEYMAINLRQALIMPLTSNDISSCVYLNEHQLLCNLNMPIYNIKTINSICEASIINNSAAPTCRTMVSDCRDEWIQLHKRDTWLFACCEECTMRIFCPAGDASHTLRHNGILTIASGCMLQGEHHLIYSHNNFRSEFQINDEKIYIPESGINHFLKDNTNLTLNIETHEEQLISLHTKIQNIKNLQDNLILQSDTADIHQYATYGFVAIIIVSFLIWMTYKIIKKYVGSKSIPTNDSETTEQGRKQEEHDFQGVVTSEAKSYWSRAQLNREDSTSTNTFDKATSPTPPHKTN